MKGDIKGNIKGDSSDKISGFLPPINDYSSRKEWEEACWRKILKSEKLLKLFSTANERHNIVMRCAALEKISDGKSYRKIAEELNISLQTINSIKKGINEKTYKSYLERGKTERKKKTYSLSPIPDKPKRRGRIIHSKFGTFQAPF